jgi:phosphoglycolate phosphatase-like HAD superfamily hydrolase
MSRLVLFDVDRTLLTGNAVHEQAFHHALARVHGVDGSIQLVSHHGKTDAGLIVEVLELCGVPGEQARSRLGEVREQMVEYFLAHVHECGSTPLPGVPEALAALERRGVLCGLVTGNIEAIARGKLRRHDLERHFPLGGFGSETEDRAELIRIALRQAQAIKPVQAPNVFHVGDTPADLEAARRAGVNGVGVATGIYDLQTLARCPHHAVLPDLSDTESFLRALGV